MRAGMVLATALLASPVAPPAFSQAASPLLLPPIVYVGDRARLVVPVEPVSGIGNAEGLVVDVAASLPRTPDVVIHRLETQSSLGKTRVLIDFTPYAVGIIPLPTLEIGPYVLKDVAVPVASILGDQADPTLSPHAEGLSVPGTSALVFGILLAFSLALIAVSYMLLRGGTGLREWRARRRRNLALRSLRRVLARLGAEGWERGGASLDILCAEFRSYLTYRSSINCLALTPKEFLTLGEGIPLRDHGPSLATVFGRLDEARFGGEPLDSQAFGQLLSLISSSIDGLESVP